MRAMFTCVNSTPVGIVQVTFTRKNLSESQCAGPVHAPFFPAVKHEAEGSKILELTINLLDVFGL